MSRWRRSEGGPAQIHLSWKSRTRTTAEAAIIRGLLALLALLLALAGQYFLEYREALTPGLYLLLAGGLALAAAHVGRPAVFLSSLESGTETTPSAGGEFTRFLVALPVALSLLGLSLYRSASNPDDSLAWMLHIASIITFLALLYRPSPGGIGRWFRRALPRPSPASLVEGGLLLGVLALGVSLRLLLLNVMPFGLWYDEAIHGMAAVRILEEDSYRPIFVPEANVASPIIFIQAASVWLLGRSTAALRLPSVIMDVGLILLLYLLARRFLGWRVALMVAFLLAVSSWDITWARSAMPGVTAPFFAVASVLLFLWALRRRDLASCALAGVVLGSGLWYYQAVRVMPLVMVFVAAYVFLRGRPPAGEFTRRFGVYVVGAFLVAAPILQYAVTHATEFWRRAMVVTSSSTGSSLDAFGFLRANLDEYLLMFNFRGDVNGRHNLPGEPMLDFGVAALAALGFLFCLTRPRRPVPFTLLVWFFFALLPGLVTLPFESPNTLRAIGTLPVVYLFAGVAIAALGMALVPLISSASRYGAVLLGIPLLAGMGAIAYDNFHTYFNLQRSNFDVWASFNPVQTAIAYRLLELPSRDYDVLISPFLAPYPVITFLVPHSPRMEIFNSARHPPASNRGDGALMFLDRDQETYMSRVLAFYPQRSFSIMDFGHGSRQPLVYTLELNAEDIRGSQGLTARYASLGPLQWDRLDDRVSQIDLLWGDGSAPAPPFAVEWAGVLYVPKYGDYRLMLEGSPQARFYLDGSLVLEGPGEVALPLALGNHALLVKEEVREAGGRTRLSWGPPEGQPSVIGPENLYAEVESRGLLGSYFPPGFPEASGEFQQIDPTVFSFFHLRPFAGEFRILWKGELEISIEGTYGFKLDSSGPATLSIDGESLITNPGIPAEGSAPHESRSASRELAPGLHPIEITFQHRYGAPQIYLHWSPLYGSPAPLPWSRLRPAPPEPLRSAQEAAPMPRQ
ncbi:MAG: hypothetical protein HW388_1310 [Dehalococcoidia bacterium]|nr:hypothetical protein [Dehalococcoidia bacterium]